jgi:hypothetical protein
MPENRLKSPFLAHREDRALYAATFVAAVTSIAALLLHVAGAIRMPYTLSFLTAPGMIPSCASRSGRGARAGPFWSIGFASVSSAA